MEIQNVTKEELKSYLEEKGTTATWLGSTLGVTKATVSRWLSGAVEIPEPADKLLRLLIRGEVPFRGLAPEAPEAGKLRFNEFEWRLFEVLRIREGFDCVEDWLVDKVRTYIGLSGAAQKVAEAIAEHSPVDIAATRGGTIAIGQVKYPKAGRGKTGPASSSSGKALAPEPLSANERAAK